MHFDRDWETCLPVTIVIGKQVSQSRSRQKQHNTTGTDRHSKSVVTSKDFPTTAECIKGMELLAGADHHSKSTVTAEVCTLGRYFTTLPMCLSAIANQTRKPERLKIYDDGEQLDLRELAPYDGILRMLDECGVEWEMIKTPRLGQVANHQHCLDTADTTYIWRVDDDEIPAPDCLERLLNTFRDYGRGGEADNIGTGS